MYFNAPVLVVLATLGTTILAAPTKVGKREPTNVTCTPNSQGVNVCCDSFGGCELQNDISDPSIIENRSFENTL